MMASSADMGVSDEAVSNEDSAGDPRLQRAFAETKTLLVDQNLAFFLLTAFL